MNRYSTENIFTRFDGKRAFRTTRYPTIPVYENDIYITVTSADFLDTLANKYYRDENLWWVISQANNLRGTMKPKNGTQLRIPGNISDVLIRFSNANK
jgi:hypothetical protein